MQVIRRRGALVNTRKALAKGSLTIGFLGGSITDGRTEWNWPDPVCHWFKEKYPNLQITVENGAIGATGSESAVFRAERTVIARRPELVFVEYAVNDWWENHEHRMRTREGLIRKLLRENRDVVLVYTYGQYMYPDMAAGKEPHSIADFEKLAKHYNISSVWMALHAFKQMQQGSLRFEAWLPDALHPQFRGSQVYAESVINLLSAELSGKAGNAGVPCGKKRPKPYNPEHWENAHVLPLTAAKTKGLWLLKRWNKYGFIDQVLSTSALGASLSLAFNGKGLVLGFDFGKNSAEFRYRFDGGEWQISNRDRPDWAGPDGWLRTFVAAENLPKGKHLFEMETVHGNHGGDAALNTRYTGTVTNLGFIGVIA